MIDVQVMAVAMVRGNVALVVVVSMELVVALEDVSVAVIAIMRDVAVVVVVVKLAKRSGVTEMVSAARVMEDERPMVVVDVIMVLIKDEQMAHVRNLHHKYNHHGDSIIIHNSNNNVNYYHHNQNQK